MEYAKEWEYAKGSASVWKWGLKDANPRRRAVGMRFFCALVHEKQVTNGGIKAQEMNATVKAR